MARTERDYRGNLISDGAYVQANPLVDSYLESRTVAITRPAGKGADTAEFIRSLGWIPFIFHTVELKPLDDEKIRDQVQSCLSKGPIDWIVFMSSSGVKLLFDNLPSHPDMQEFLRSPRFLAVGPRTREALVRHGSTNVSVPERYSSPGVDEFFSQLGSKNLRIVLIRSSSADDSLASSLIARGAKVTTVNVYESRLPKDLQSTFDFLEGLLVNRFAAVLFTSAISVSNLFKIAEAKFEASQVTILLKHLRVGAIGPVTARELRKHGIEPILPDEYLIDNALKKIVNS